MRIWKNHPLLKLVNSYIVDSPQPSNLSYLWNFGSLLALSLIIQIITGVTLAMHYNANTLDAFNSVEHIMRDVNNGWLIRYLHSNTASAFFFLVYIHIGRGLYYGSYKTPRTLVWTIGTIIFILMIATAFLGYVLPYGQMSLWGATVITNLMSAIPWVGQDIVQFIWGGFSVNNATLNRFFALHFVLPFILAALALMHLITLHERAGSGNPLGLSGNTDRLPFAPYFIFKDLITIFVFMLALSILVFYMPNVLGDSENYVMANPMQTPPAIVPEWYLLPFYAILRSIPNKLLGVIAMFSAILILLLMSLTDLYRSRGIQFKPLGRILFFLFVANFLALLQLGAEHVESPFIEFGQVSTVLYFAHFLIIIPFAGIIENSLTDILDTFTDKKISNPHQKDVPTYMVTNSFLVSHVFYVNNAYPGSPSNIRRDASKAYHAGKVVDENDEDWSTFEEMEEKAGKAMSDYSDDEQLEDPSEDRQRIINRYYRDLKELELERKNKRTNSSVEKHVEETNNENISNNEQVVSNNEQVVSSNEQVISNENSSLVTRIYTEESENQQKTLTSWFYSLSEESEQENLGSKFSSDSSSEEELDSESGDEELYPGSEDESHPGSEDQLHPVREQEELDSGSEEEEYSESEEEGYYESEEEEYSESEEERYSGSEESCDAPEPWGFYFQDSGTPQMEALVELHDNIMFYLVIVLFGVGWTLISIINVYNSTSSPISHKYLSHGASIELIWTITPAIILILIAFPSFKLLYLMDEVSDPAMVVLAEGHQWYWSYQYADFIDEDEEFVEFDSYLVPESDLEYGALRMLEVDNRLIIPELTHVRFVVAGADVIHCFACPSLGIKCDAYPGRLNQASIMINRAATFYGQCSEICGILHSSMPIVIESVSIEKYMSWLLSL